MGALAARHNARAATDAARLFGRVRDRLPAPPLSVQIREHAPRLNEALIEHLNAMRKVAQRI